MYKLFWILMPIFAFIALVFVINDFDFSFYSLIKELQKIDFVKFDYSDIKETFDGLDFSEIWSSVGDAWSNVEGIGSFFEALGKTFTGTFDTLFALFEVIIGFAKFIFEFLKFFVINLFYIFRYLFSYIII